MWPVNNPKEVGEGTLSPRTVKALALLEANRVLLWSPHHQEGGGVHTFEGGYVRTRAVLRLSEREYRALEGNRFINSHRMVSRSTVYETYGGSVVYLEGMKWSWLLAPNGREALYAHDRRAGVLRTYHEFDPRLLDW